MEHYYQEALNTLTKVGVELKRSKISNLEAADKICETLCSVVAHYYGGKAAEATQSIRKEFGE